MREAVILRRVLHNKQTFLLNSVRTKGNIARGLLNAHAFPGLEPLPSLVNQGNQRDWRFTDPGGKFRQVVKDLLRHRVEHIVLPEDFEPLLFVLGSLHHAGLTAFLDQTYRGVRMKSIPLFGCRIPWFSLPGARLPAAQMPRLLLTRLPLPRTMMRGVHFLAFDSVAEVKLMMVIMFPFFPRCAAAPFNTMCPDPASPGIA